MRAPPSSFPPADPPPAPPAPGELVTDRIRLLRPLGRGGMGSVWVGEHLTLGIEVAVKFVVGGAGDRNLDRRLEREARLAARVRHPHAVRVLDHGITARGLPFLVMELVAGETLADRLTRGPLPVAEARALVRQLAGALDAAHAAGVVHRDVKPANVLLVAGADGLFAKLVDFGIARPVDPGFTTLTHAGQIVGTPAYLAPEQLIDVRPADAGADLWALGVLAYEALCNRRPFDAATLAGVVVALMMRRFAPITSVDPTLPAGLDAFFDRAFHAEPARRYASGAELADALDRAILAGPSAAAPAADAALRLPDRVYGRERELGVLEEAFRAAARGSARAVIVSGWSGTGKTSLVVELRRRLGPSSVSVAAGKFDPYDRGRPYQSLIQALRQLLRETLERREPTLTAWRDRILSTFGGNPAPLHEQIRELEALVGPSEPEEATPAEQRARFQVAMSRLVAALATPERPLLVFCDDLQWADLSSLDLVGALATDPELRHVLIVCAYRDNEVRGTHPLLPVLERMRAAGRVDEIALRPLDLDAVLDLVTDALPGLPGRLRLASAAHARTRGNAFFLRRFLEGLAARGLLRREGGRWTWDPDAVDALDMPDDVVSFVAAEIAAMPEPAREAIAVAACIGDRFELDALAHALGCDRAAALDRLRPALASELVVATAGEGLAAERVVFRFVHDRVRQAAHGALPEEVAAAVHRTVGAFLLDHLQGAELESRLFEVVEHLNRGAGELRPGERARLRALNLEAGRRAIRSAAFEVGDRYLRHALAALEPASWSADYPQALAIHLDGARAAWLVGDHDRMDALVDAAARHAREPLHRAMAHEIRVQARLSQQRFRDALRLALDALAELGARLPEAPTPAAAGAAIAETTALVAATPPEALERIPISDDPLVHARQRLATGAMSSAYMAAPTLLPLLACEIVRSTLSEGAGKESAYGFAALALVLVAEGRIDAGYRMGRIAAEMLDRVGERSTRARTLHLLSAHVMLFVEPLRDWAAEERQVARLGLDAGDLEYAGWGLHCEVCNGFYAGVPLAELERTFERNRAALEHHRQLAALGCTLQYGRALVALRGGAADPARLDGPDYDERERAAAFREANFRGAAFILAVIAGFLRFLFRRLDEAVDTLDAGAEFADGAPATYHVVWWTQLRVLAALARVRAGDPRAAAALAEVAPHVARLRGWRAFSEVNHAHRLDLVDAELARVEGRPADALAHLASAARRAAAERFRHEEALAHELAARLHREAGDPARAAEAAREAVRAWERWGATAKAAHLAAELSVE